MDNIEYDDGYWLEQEYDAYKCEDPSGCDRPGLDEVIRWDDDGQRHSLFLCFHHLTGGA